MRRREEALCANHVFSSFANKALPRSNVDEALYSALMLQPRIVGAVAAIGIIAQSPWLFLTLVGGVVVERARSGP